MNTYITTSGVGTEVNEISVQGLIDLMKKSPKTMKDYPHIDISDENLSIADFDSDEYDIIAECLTELTKIEFVTVSDDDGCHYILFPDKSPWEYTTREKRLKRKDIVDIFKEYLSDVIPDIEFENLYIANYIMD